MSLSFYDTTIKTSALFDSPRRINNLALLEPVTRAAVMAIVRDAMLAGTPVMVFETYRSQERQEALFAQGATQLKTVGCHGFGLACDIVKNVNGDPSWQGSFAFLGVLAKRHNLVWGGDWDQPVVRGEFQDMDHVQRINVSDQPRLFDGSWFPDPSYLAEPVT